MLAVFGHAAEGGFNQVVADNGGNAFVGAEMAEHQCDRAQVGNPVGEEADVVGIGTGCGVKVFLVLKNKIIILVKNLQTVLFTEKSGVGATIIPFTFFGQDTRAENHVKSQAAEIAGLELGGLIVVEGGEMADGGGEIEIGQMVLQQQGLVADALEQGRGNFVQCIFHGACKKILKTMV